MEHVATYPNAEFTDWLVRRAEMSGSDVGEVLLLLAVQGLSTFAAVSGEDDIKPIAAKQMKDLSQRTGWDAHGIQIEWRYADLP